jgi:PHD/YefM family antitoxin component YafN of YafNO toxin-antitoxin module
MDVKCFQSLELTRLKRTLNKLHEQVHGRHGRIEITRDGCDHVCVLMSKAELESLERALEILAETEAFKAMSEQIAQVAAECGGSDAMGSSQAGKA